MSTDDETDRTHPPGYPEGNPEGPGDQRGGDETDTTDAPDTSAPEEGDAGQATGNPGAAG